MTPNGIVQIGIFLVVLLLVTKPMGAYMARVFEGERTLLSPLFAPIERLFYKLFGVDAKQDMKWTTYTLTMLMFSVVGMLFTYALLRLQGALPFKDRKSVV